MGDPGRARLGCVVFLSGMVSSATMSKLNRIAFEPSLPFSRRPFRARVVLLPGGHRLGIVRWAPRRRQYVFEPMGNKSLDAGLTDAIAGFINALPAEGARL